MRGLALALILALASFTQSGAAQELIPERRLVYTENADLPGGDFANQRNSSIEACEIACLTDRRCTALTFNSRANACFLKADPGAPTFYQGAYSASVVAASTDAIRRAAARAPDLAFLQQSDLERAFAQAKALGGLHITGEFTPESHMASAQEAERRRDYEGAAAFVGAALNVTDAGGDWAEYARLLLLASTVDTNRRQELLDRAALAGVNAYLRTEAPAARHSILSGMASALEFSGRGRETVSALRLAQTLQPRDDTALLLDAAIGKYGFRVTDTDVQSDAARPRLCAVFSEPLVKAGVDYTPFVQLPAAGLTVVLAGDRQLCVEGVSHGQRVAVTFREGLPAADGQTTAKDVTLTAYIRDRSPAVAFPGRGYVLPAGGDPALPVETVNTDALALTLYRVTDRNLLRAVQNDYFGQPMAYWQEDDFASQIGEALWTGTATVAMEVNRDMTTRLPMADALAGQGAGIYALKAAIPGRDGSETGPAWQWFVVSDLGITTLSGVDGLHAVVRSLGSAGPKPGVTVELLSRANAVLGTAVTDAEGMVTFAPGLSRGTGPAAPAMVVAKDGAADIAFLSLTDPEFDLSDRGVEGRQLAGPLDVFLTTDRGAYRAGEVVHLTALVRDARAEAVTGLPLTAVLKRPDGVEYSRALVADQGAGGHVFDLPIAGSAPRGRWQVELRADADAAPLASAGFLVEDFLPERIDFALTVPDAALRLGDTAAVTVSAKYLFGPPAADLAVEGETTLRAAAGLAAFPGYVFGRADERFDPRYASFEGGIRTDASGEAVIDAALPEAPDPGRPLEARFTVRVAEGSGRPVEREVVKALTPAAPMIGVKPLFDGVVGEGSEARFALVGVGVDEAPQPMSLVWELTRIETRYQWYQEYGNWYWEPVTTRSRVAEGTADPGAAPVEIGARVTWGEYELKVAEAGGGAETSTTFYAGWYAPADVTATPDTLALSLDKPAYAPGETAMLRVVPRAGGTALIAVLSNRVVEMKTVAVTEGENLIPLTVTDDWGAGVYVTASVLRPMDVAAGRNPARALGLAHAAIDPGMHKLTAAVETAPEAAPRGPLDVAVKVEGIAPGDTAYATIAAVDVGILNLTAFKAPDPSAHYFGQRRLGVGIRDVYGRLIDGLNGAEGTVRSGGDAGAQAKLQAPPPTEELVAYFAGPVTVGADGYARASFDLPSFNGTVRVMAVVWSGKGVGQASADVLVRDPVVVTASLPRFLSPGDRSRLLLEVVHATGPAGRMGLDVTADGLTLGQVPSGFDLAEQGKAVFSVPVTAGGVGIQTIDVALTTPDGRQLRKRLAVPVQVNDPEVARSTAVELANGQSFTFDGAAFAGLDPATGKATLAVGPIAWLDAPGLLAALDRYPYGCTEQITSKALPLIYFDQVAQAMQLKGADNIRERIGQAVAEVLLNQSAEGAFGLWQAGAGDFWLDAYVTDFLSRARAQGFDVPDLAFRSALDNLRNQVNYAADFDTGGEALAYALMVLAREGAAAVGDLRYFADVKGDDFATPIAQAQLGAALASYGDQARADAMFRRAAARVATANDSLQLYRADYGSNRRDAAALLTLATEAGSEAVDADALAATLARPGSTLSTQEQAWTLLAANALISGASAQGITFNGLPPSGPLVRVLGGGVGDPVVVQNGSGRAQTVTVTAYGVPVEPEPAGGNGYGITRDYYTLDGQAVDIRAGVAAGTRLVVVLTVQPFNRGEARLMVADPLPAGFEIDNPNLLQGGQISALDWLQLEGNISHAEFRQDRFLAALDRSSTDPFTLAYIVRAVAPGVFHHAAASVEDMYRPDFRARTETGEVTVTE